MDAMLATSYPLTIEGLSVAYEGTPALRDVSWHLGRGTIAAIVGPNGAGKSTLMKAVLGLVAVQSGSVVLFGGGISDNRDRVAYVPQRAGVDWEFPVSALDVVVMGLTRRIGWLRRVRGGHRAAAMNALKAVGLTDKADAPIGALSGGQQQRVFIARALVQDADLYLLDEPFAGVDAATEGVIVDVFRQLKKQGKSIVVIHHDLGTVKHYFDEVLLLANRKVASGPVDETFTDANLVAAYGGRLAVIGPRDAQPSPVPA